jgi:hypothetical protein
VKIIIEIDTVHLAALDALAERYSVGRDEMIALLVTAASIREEAAEPIRTILTEGELKSH